MKHKKKIDVTLLIGLAIPVVMIAVFAATITVFRYLADIEEPRYDFLYAVGTAQEYRYSVKNGRLRRDKLKPEKAASSGFVSPGLNFFVHSVTKNTSEQVSFDQASTLSLDTTALSPDGFRVEFGRRSGLLPMFSSRDYRTRYLRRQGFAMKLKLEIGDGYSYRMLGWIEE